MPTCHETNPCICHTLSWIHFHCMVVYKCNKVYLFLRLTPCWFFWQRKYTKGACANCQTLDLRSRSKIITLLNFWQMNKSAVWFKRALRSLVLILLHFLMILKYIYLYVNSEYLRHDVRFLGVRMFHPLYFFLTWSCVNYVSTHQPKKGFKMDPISVF